MYFTKSENRYTVINYVFIGDRHKPVILFLHGFMGSLSDFAEVAELLKKDFCSLLIDLPGHGKTEVNCDRDYQMPAVAIAIIDLLQQLAIEKCFLVGYSMGGRLALYLAVYFPQYFQKVILESASPGLEDKLEREKRIQHDLKIANRLQSLDLAVFLQQWYSNPLFIYFRKHPNYSWAISNRLKNDSVKLSKSLIHMGLGVQPSLWQHLPSIQLPILLIVGKLDSKFILVNQKISSLSPRFQIEIVENTDHNVHFERASDFTRILKEFLVDRI